MATTENLPSPSAERPVGFGRLKRKEDARFIRGKGTYLDDIRLPGMVHGAMLRSPFAHARILSIDTSRALAHPNVAAVITAKDLETLGLAWMPTISYDTQAVLAGDKVRFQGQEVAFVIATDEYSANDALGLIDGQPVKSCTTLAVMADGHEVRTVESLEVDGELDPIQMGFHERHALQCGFCTPGMLMTTRALLDENPDPTDHEIRTAISGANCRCTGYKNIVSAVRWAADHEAAARQKS